jgi:hypothetical protein
MEQKNKSMMKTVILLIAIVAPSFYLFSSYHNPKMPANNKFRRQKARRSRVPTRSVGLEPTMQPADEEIIPEEPASITQEQEPENQESQDKESATNAVAVAQDVAVNQPSPGILMSIYATVMPVILVTMNKALGGGIEASTKSVIERYLNRRQFFSLKDTIMAKMDAMMKPGFKGISDKQKNILKGLSDKERLEVGKQNFLSSKEQKAFDNLEQQSSTASIFSQALYMGMINTVVPFIATFIGLGATMGLQTLMPAANSQ